jgi:DNA-directed RNA polymerase
MNALMPNLIHSLDAYTLMKLINLLINQYPDISFYSVHDCFAVTADKISDLLTVIRSVYTLLYSDSKYILNFDHGVINKIKDMYNDQINFDTDTRTFTLVNSTKKYPIPDID